MGQFAFSGNGLYTPGETSYFATVRNPRRKEAALQQKDRELEHLAFWSRVERNLPYASVGLIALAVVLSQVPAGPIVRGYPRGCAR